MLRVGFIGPIGVRGPSFRRYLGELSEALSRDPRLRVLHFLRPAEVAPRGHRQQFPGRAILGRLRLRIRRRWRRRVPSEVRNFQADVFHLIAPGDAWLIPHLPHQRVIVTVHDFLASADWTPGVGPPRLSDRHVKGLQTLAAATHIVCVSELARSEVLSLLDIDPGRVSVIHNGLHPRFHPLSPDTLDAARALLQPAQFRLLQVVSTAGPRKNTEAILQVLKRLRAEGMDVRLIRLGSLLSREHVQYAEALGVLDQIDDLGRVDEDMLIALYNVADVMLFPSRHEGFGWPPLEAMACGTPVVASNIEACVEVLGDAGFLVGPDDIDAMLAHTCTLLTDPAVAADYRERGLARAAGFSWDAAAAAFADLYREVAESPADAS